MGSCAQIGAVAAQQLARDLERNAESAEPDVLHSLIERMEQECQRHEAWLASAIARAAEGT
jgi:HPt (histidine-containing phosphotransfer) domain-containing protein